MGINTRLETIEQKLKEEEIKKEKKFRLPFGKKVGKGQAKKNYVTVMKINENGNVEFKKIQIKDQTIMEDGVPRLATPDYVLRFKKNPMIILPSWSVEPFSPKQNFDNSLENGSNTKGYKILMAKMLSEALNAKKPMGNLLKILIGVGLAAVIGYAFMSGGGTA
jgi:hypothetical protein